MKPESVIPIGMGTTDYENAAILSLSKGERAISVAISMTIATDTTEDENAGLPTPDASSAEGWSRPARSTDSSA